MFVTQFLAFSVLKEHGFAFSALTLLIGH